MPDREKVIKGLECCAAVNCGQSCPYAPVGGCRVQVLRDAIALLKEQEPIDPHVERDSDDDTWYYGCVACHMDINPGDKFCRHCGTKVKWDD